jgi:hypothetical protein
MADTNLTKKNLVKKRPKKKELEMSQTIHLDIISHRVPAEPNMFITICSDNIPFILGKNECSKRRCMAKDQLPSRWVFMG